MALDIENNPNYTQTQIAKLTKCAACGADLIFDCKSNTLFCEHCESRYSVPNVPFTQKNEFEPTNLSDENVTNEESLVKCLNCGASVKVNTSTMSHICPFCGSAKLTTESNLSYKPDAIVPFGLEKNDLQPIFKKWIKKRWFKPKGLKSINTIESIKAMYMPSWLFDTKTATKFSGVLEFDRQESYTDREGRTHTRTVTDRKNVSGQRNDNFSNMICYSGNEMERYAFAKIEPFDLTNIKVFSDEYLAGYFANQYNIDIKKSWKVTKDNYEREIKDRIVDSYRADRYSYLNLDVKNSDSKYAYTFLPVWVGNYFYNSKIYNFFINGTTGKIYGKAPINKFKLTMFIIFITLIVIALIYFGSLYSNGVK